MVILVRGKVLEDQRYHFDHTLSAILIILFSSMCKKILFQIRDRENQLGCCFLAF